MKKIYRMILGLLGNLPVILEIIKTYIAEWVAIIRKRPLYKHIKWTKEQQKEFDEYWKKNYGKKISNRWHKLYEASNGVHRTDYLPEIIYSTKIEPRQNNYTYCCVYADKNLNGIFFNNRIENVRTPDCFLSNNHSYFYDGNRNIISREKAVDILNNAGKAVIKPAVDSSSGHDVIIVDMKNGRDIRSGKAAQDIFEYYKNNFIVQEKIEQSSELSTLYPSSINTVRVISYIVDDEVCVAPVSLRIGGNGSEVDNIHAGGMSIAVSDDGALAERAYRLGYGDSFECFDKHPDTGVVFKGYKLSFVDRLISTAKRLHGMTANIGVISWDFTVDNNDNIVVIEANFRGQSVWFPQMLSGESFYGKNTEKVLQALR